MCIFLLQSEEMDQEKVTFSTVCEPQINLPYSGIFFFSFGVIIICFSKTVLRLCFLSHPVCAQ